MKRICLLALVVGTWPGPGIAQTTEELVNDGQNSDNVLTGNPIGLVTGSPNMSRKVDWRRVSSCARDSRRLARKASAASSIPAIRFCSGRGGRGIWSFTLNAPDGTQVHHPRIVSTICPLFVVVNCHQTHQFHLI